MHRNVDINWAAFQYIFSSNPRSAFERLAYQLFCFEFNQPYGIFRYYNQPSIETIPVLSEGGYIGFQAKYYDASTRLSEKSRELKDAIRNTHEKYQEINRIIFYINKEPGMSTKSGNKKPTYIVGIEKYGQDLGIQIEWRGPAQFEVILFKPELAEIRDYFFNADKGIRCYLSQIEAHSQIIFHNIASEILFEGRSVKINREGFDLTAFYKAATNTLLVYGEGGSGKSGLVKDLFQNEKEFPVCIFRAADFDTSNLAEFSRKFGEYTFEEFLAVFDGTEKKVCIIDSAEKIFTMEHQETFLNAVQLLFQHHWKLVVTLRTSYKDNFINAILKTTDGQEHQVARLSAEELAALEKEEELPLPIDSKLRDFLCNLFYLRIYLSNPEFFKSNSVAGFSQKVWDEIICNSLKRAAEMDIRRGDMVCRIVESNANEGTSYYVSRGGEDREAIASLAEGGIIQHDDVMGGYFVTHDVYEEIILKRIIHVEFNRKRGINEFFHRIGNSLVMRKALRIWLFDLLCSQDEIPGFLAATLADEQLESIWKDEILTALLNTPSSDYYWFLDRILKEKDYHLFFRAMSLLNTACKVVDEQHWEQAQTVDADKIWAGNRYRFTCPSGDGWKYLIPYANEHREEISWDPIKIIMVVNALFTWTNSYHDGETTQKAGILAMYFYHLVKSDNRFRYRFDTNKIEKINTAILNSSSAILPELSVIFEAVVAKNATNYDDIHHDLCKQVLRNVISSGKICFVAPDLVIALANCFWLQKSKKGGRWHSNPDDSEDFGLDPRIWHEYSPTSAYQTPILTLLQAAPPKALDFITKLLNQTTEAYKRSDSNKEYSQCSEMELIFPGGIRLHQTVSDRLWNMHRGNSSAPDLLECVLMALERWLYGIIPQISENMANNICMRLLMESHSAAITAVVVSMVIAYPNKLFRTACVLMHTKEIFMLDLRRYTSEHIGSFFRGAGMKDDIYDQERIQSNNLLFRKKRLEEVILEYQLNGGGMPSDTYKERLEMLRQIFDETFENYESMDEKYQFLLHRIDLRKIKLAEVKPEKAEEPQIILIPDLPEHLVKSQEENRERTKDYDKHMEISVWSQARFENNSRVYERYTQYETNPVSALTDLLELVAGPPLLDADKSTLIYVSAVLLRDFESALDQDAIKKCADILYDYLYFIVERSKEWDVGGGASAAVASIPYLIENMEERDAMDFDSPVMLLLALLLGSGMNRSLAIQVFRVKIYQIDSYLSRNILGAFIALKPDYNQEVLRFEGVKPKEFFESWGDRLREIFSCTREEIPSFNHLDYYAMQTLSMLMPTSEVLSQRVLLNAGEQIWPTLFSDRDLDGKADSRDFRQENEYISWLAEYLLRKDAKDQRTILYSLAPYLMASDSTNDLLTQIIFVQNNIKANDSFWSLWDRFLEAIENLCCHQKESLVRADNDDRFYADRLYQIVETYMFAFPWWEKNIRSWHTLDVHHADFFGKTAQRLGYHPGALYSIARVLNTVGYEFLDQGVDWLAIIVRNNPHIREKVLQTDTEYYLEEYMQRFVSVKRNLIKRKPELRQKTIDVLSFLVDRGSTCGYILRESIC